MNREANTISSKAGEAEIVRGELKQAKVNGLEMSPAELDSRASTNATRLGEVSVARQKRARSEKSISCAIASVSASICLLSSDCRIVCFRHC